MFFYIIYATLNITFAVNPDFNLNTIIIKVDTERKDKVLQLRIVIFSLNKVVGVVLFIKDKTRSNWSKYIEFRSFRIDQFLNIDQFFMAGFLNPKKLIYHIN